MPVIDDVFAANAAYAAGFPGARSSRPALQLAVLACMDARIELAAALGLRIGQAHLLRNAGGLPTEDMLRSLAVSQHALGTREVMVVHHTECGMQGLDDAAFRAELAASTGSTPPWDVPGFTDLEAQVRASVRRIRDCPWLPHRDQVRGFVFDVRTGRLSEVAPAAS